MLATTSRTCLQPRVEVVRAAPLPEPAAAADGSSLSSVISFE